MARILAALSRGIVAALALAACPGAAFAVQPLPIDDLTATPEGSTVRLAWSLSAPSDGDEISKMEVRYRTAGPFDSKEDWEGATGVYEHPEAIVLKAGETLSFEHTTGELPAGTYWFAAAAYSAGDWGPLSSTNPPPVTIGGPIVVPPVTGLAVVGGSATLDSLALTWNALTGGATEIRLYYSTSSEPFPSTPATDWIPGSPAQVTVTLPAPGTTYTFAARARTAVNQESELSAAPHASGTTLSAGDPPGGPADGGSSSSPCGQSAGPAGLLPVLLAGILLRRRIS